MQTQSSHRFGPSLVFLTLNSAHASVLYKCKFETYGFRLLFLNQVSKPWHFVTYLTSYRSLRPKQVVLSPHGVHVVDHNFGYSSL